jgi:hypothetical protein
VISPSCAPLARAGTFWVSLRMVHHCLDSVPASAGGTVDVAVGDATNSYHVCVTGNLLEKEPAFALDPGVLMLWQHLHILAQNQAREETGL